MKRIAVGLMGAVLSAGVFAAPTILENSVTVVQPVSGKVDISYVLPGPDPAVITIDIQQNGGGEWVSVGDEKVRTLSGEVNKAVAPSANPRTIRWDAATDWPRQKITSGKVRAVVEAWPTNAPPPWMVVALDTAEVRFYRSETALPYTLTDLKMKTDYLVMRKVPAANVTWRMGKVGVTSPTLENQKPRMVTLTEDYYIGAYPLTQAQFTTIKAKTGYSRTVSFTAGCGDDYPLYTLAYAHYRGERPTYDWPNTLPLHEVDPESLIGKLRAYVGQGLEFDLPTEAQWEYACRAGTTGDWNAADAEDTCYVGKKTSARSCGYSHNAWGLYDMHGNCGEYCLDYWASYDPAEQADPKGGTGDADGTTPPKRIARGGYYSLANTAYCTSTYRTRRDDNSGHQYFGARLVCPPVVALPKAANGRLVLTLDDRSSIDSWLNAVPTFRKYDAHVTFFVDNELDAATLASLKTLAADGHTIGCHGRLAGQKVTDLISSLGATGFIAQDITPQKSAAAAAGLSVSCFAYPSSARSAVTDAVLFDEFARLRTGQLSGRDPSTTPLKNQDSAFISAANTHGQRLISASCVMSSNALCVQEICEALERAAANDETLALYAHAIEQTGSVAADVHNVTVPQLEAIFAKAQELGVAIVGFDEL